MGWSSSTGPGREEASGHSTEGRTPRDKALLDSGRKGKNFRERMKLQVCGESGKERECTVSGAWVHLHSVTDSLRNLLLRLADVIQWEGDSQAGSLGASDQCASPHRPLKPSLGYCPASWKSGKVGKSLTGIKGSPSCSSWIACFAHHAHHGSLALVLV